MEKFEDQAIQLADRAAALHSVASRPTTDAQDAKRKLVEIQEALVRLNDSPLSVLGTLR